MRLTLTTVLVVTGLTLSAQNWCPPGATWTYDSHGFVMLQYGYTTLTYASDTLLGGFTGQVILGQTVGINSEQELDSIPNGAITRHEGHVVYTWSHFAQAWDTLYNFAAVPGEHWQPPFAQPNLCGGAEFGDAVQVLDTGTVVIGGVPLRYLDIHNGFYDGIVTERLGFAMGMMLAEGCWVPECLCDLRCYHDAEINYVRSDLTTPCEFVGNGATSLERFSDVSMSASPNPGTDHFDLRLPKGVHAITVFDATGRLLSRRSMTGERARVGTADLPSGIYLVRVDEGSVPLRWVKE